MGRWDWSNRDTVEDCKSISVFWLKKQGYLKKDIISTSGGMRWTNSMGDYKGSIGFIIEMQEDRGQMRFQYTYTNPSNEEKEELDYFVNLVSTSCNYGNRRWWFICTTTNNGVYCGRRVGKLYLGSGGKFFACRHCYDLTYQSCKDSHKFDSIAYEMGITPNLLNRLFKDSK